MTIRVSVVIPTYRRHDLLERCLGALLKQTLDAGDYEIIVADDGHDPTTAAQVARWSSANGNRPRIVYVPVRGEHGPAAARNAGWRAANGDIIAFTDDDTLPCPDWLEQGIATLAKGRAPPIVAASGRVHVPLEGDRPSDYELDASRLGAGEFVTANCFVRRDALRAIGGFDTRFTAAWREDSDLHFSLLEAQGRIVRANSATVVHPVRRAGFGVALRQQRKILFDALLYKKHRRLYREKIRARPRWDYYAIVVSLVVAVIAALELSTRVALTAFVLWLLLTAQFVWQRLKHTSHAPAHVMEVVLTSALIPPLAVFWRFIGALRFRVLFL